MANPGGVKKGNYVRRKQRSLSPASSTAPRPGAGAGSSKSAGQPADPNRVQFEQQEDFISFDVSDGEPDSTAASHHHRRGDRGGKRKHDDGIDDDVQDEGTRQLRKREKERSTPWCDEPGLSWSSYDTATMQLNAEAKSYISYISPTPVEHELRMFTIEIIRRTIKSKYADADVECFGSVGTGLYLPGGDIDLVVLCPSMPSPPLKPSSSLLHRLASLLLTSSIAQPSSLVVIAKARVPIVKFTTRYGGFQVDLSVNQKNGVDAAIRVRSMLEDFAFREEGYVEPGTTTTGGMSIKGKAAATSGGGGGKKGKEKEQHDEDDRQDSTAATAAVHVHEHVDHGVARSLVLLVKGYLAQRGMNEVFTGGLGSYSIICLVISFLQLHPKIQSAQIQPSRNIGLLFLEFLEYYGKHFNFDEAGITLKGRGGYYNKHDKGWFRPNQPYLLSIEDPNDPTNDVSGGSHNILRVRQTLAGGFDTLCATLVQRESVLAARRNPSVVPLSDRSLPNADSDPPSRDTRSLLGSIVGMTRAGVDARRANVRLWADGVLQKILERISDAGVGANGELGSKKAMKRAMKEERDRQRRERTVAKLERRIEEKERKAERKKDKKRRSREASVVVEPKVVPLVTDRRTIVEAEAAAASLKGLAGGGAAADEDSEYSARRSRGDSDEEEEGSRYSVGVPAVVAAVPKKSRSRLVEPMFTAHASDDDDVDSSDEDEDEGGEGEGEEDVVLGGGGGDFVRFDSAQHSEQDDDDDDNGAARGDDSDSSSSSRSSSDSSDQVMQSLVPAAAARSTISINGAAAAAQKGSRRKVVARPQAAEPPKKRTKQQQPPDVDGHHSSQQKKKKALQAAAKNAYWGAKGVKE